MALWVDPNDLSGERFDDGLAFMPGEDGFQPKPGWNYIGTPNWHLRIEAEARKKAIEDELARRTDPQGFAKAQAIAAIEAEHAAVMEILAGDDDAQKKAGELRAARLAELDPKIEEDLAE